MAEQLNVTTERVDDIPLLLVHSDKMGVPDLLDEYFKPHGNWEGLSLGWTTAIWDSSFTVISLLCPPYNSASYLCWTFRPISMTSFCAEFPKLP